MHYDTALQEFKIIKRIKPKERIVRLYHNSP